MRRSLVIALSLVALTPLISCGDRKAALEAAYKAWNAAVEKAPSAEQQAAATKSFLEQFPDSEHTEDAASTLAYLLGGSLGRPAEADAFLADLAARVKDPEHLHELLGVRLGVLGTLKDGDRLQQAVDDFSRGRELAFSDRSTIADAALAAGAWQLALATANAALPLATPAAITAENPARKLTAERLADSARRRRVEMLAARGWALANLGRVDEALAALREAYAADFHGYLGNTESAAGSYLGRALLMAGQRGEAEPLLAVAALYGGDRDARTELRQGFPAGPAGDRAFDTYLEGERVKLARPVADFTLPDYAGMPQTFSKLRNGEVALLSFWFPT
jgi:hypothetical protein